MPTTLQPQTDAVPSRREVWKMFDRIAHRYDLLNRMLSLGQDQVWRRRLARHLPAGEKLRVLDLATGTADQLLVLAAACPRLGEGVGVDMSERMLERGRVKIRERGLEHRLRLESGNAESIGFPEATFDAVTISFGIRNVGDVEQGLREMARVLKPGGRGLVLECSLPKQAILRRLYLLYFRHVLPALGGLISGDHYAYHYLNKTVETFPQGDDFCRLMQRAGFQTVKAIPQTLGVASIYVGEKPGRPES